MSEKAKSFATRAQHALVDFRNAKNRFDAEENVEGLRGHWSQMLSEYRKFIKFAEMSARCFDRNEWADALVREYKDSKVLLYLFHARNADEHGVIPVAQGEPAALNIGGMFSFAGDCQNITVTNCVEISRLPDGKEVVRRIDGQFSVTDGRLSDGWLESEVPLARREKFLRLGSVFDRDVKYDLPEMNCAAERVAATLSQKAFDWMVFKEKALKQMR